MPISSISVCSAAKKWPIRKKKVLTRARTHKQRRQQSRGDPCSPFLQDNIERCSVGHAHLLSCKPWLAHGHWPPTPTRSAPPPCPEKWCLTKLIQWIKGLDWVEEEGGLTLRECQFALVLTFSCCCTLKPSFYIFHSDITAEPLLHTLRCVDCIKMGGPVVPASSQSQNAMCFLVSTTITKHFPSHVPLSKMIHICFTLTHLNISAQCQLV